MRNLGSALKGHTVGSVMNHIYIIKREGGRLESPTGLGVPEKNVPHETKLLKDLTDFIFSSSYRLPS